MKAFFLFLILYFPVFGQTYDYTHNVSNTGDPSIFTNEPSVAAYNNYVVVGCNYNNWGNINRVCSFYSNDKGNSWTQVNIPKGFTGSSIDDSDPSVAFDGFGAVYFVYLSSTATHSGVFINKSTNFGQTWLTNSVEVRSAPGATSIDKPYLYVKKGSTLNETKIYVAFRYDDGTNKYIQIVNASASDLSNFSNPYSIRTVPSSSDIQSPIPYCSSSGDIYVTFIEKISATQFCIKVSRSSNGGLSFNSPINVSGSFEHIGYHDTEHNQFIYGTPFSKYFRVNCFPSITSINNTVYISWAKKINGRDQIAISKSTDYGNSWQALNVENIPPSIGQQFFPWITSTPDNKLCLTYHYCEDSDLSNSSIYSLLYLFDENTFEELDHFDFSQSFSNAGFIGDYINLVSTEDMIYSVFTSNTLIGTQYPTVIKCAAVPNKVNLNLTVYQGTNFSSTPVEIHIDGNVTNIPAGGNPLNYSSSYTFKQIDFLVTGSISGWACRNWSYANTFGNHLIKSFPYTRESDPFQMQVIYEPTLPLTVTNNLEGGTGGQYTVTWDKQPEDPHTINSGEGYNAFVYQTELNDRYSIFAPEFTSINTDWYFFNWSTGSSINPVLNYAINAPTDFTANYKGHFRSNSDVSYNSYQKNFHYLGSDQYTTFYESMGTVWELTAENYHQWAQEADILKDRLLISGTAKNPDLYFLNGLTYLVFEFTDPSNPSVSRVCLAYGENYWDNLTEIDTYNSSFFGNAKPVVAAFGQGDQLEIVVLYKKDNTHGIYYKSYCKSGGGWYWHSGILSGTSSTSSNVSIAAEKGSADHSLHICWEDQPSQIKYTRFYSYPNKLYGNQTVVSSQCPLINHHRPSISITGKNSLIVSWSADNGAGIGKITGSQPPAKRAVVRPRVGGVWGNFFISGSEVLNTFNNSSTSSSADESVIAWNENNNTTTKYVKRLNDGYCNSSLLNPNGIMPVISSGGSLADMKALVFNTESLPYIINKSDADFSTACGGGGGEIGKLSSITEENSVLYGRSGLIMVKGINFVFNTGDIVSGDSVVNFMTTTDTNQFQTAEELNEAMRTVDFELNSSSSLRFSNLYYVLNPELADSLSEDEAVSFRLELVNSATGETAGVFDEITYNKNNLEKYENISYEINCSDIQQGNYFLRLVSEVSGEAEYNLGLIQNDVSEIAKKNYVSASYYGDKVPSTYEISQNYPNPFNPATTINYQLPQNGFVILKVYDILGKEVTTLVNEQKTQGRYSINFDASRLASGVYIYQLRVNDYVSSKKMLLLK